jgi:hypothetical protein
MFFPLVKVGKNQLFDVLQFTNWLLANKTHKVLHGTHLREDYNLRKKLRKINLYQAQEPLMRHSTMMRHWVPSCDLFGLA